MFDNTIGDKILKGGVACIQVTGIALHGVQSTAAETLKSGIATAAVGIAPAVPFVFSGIVYSARVGLDYRKYKAGKISKRQFKHNAKIGLAGITGGVGGSIGGATFGFIVGTAIAPGVGSVIGTLVGGVAGGVTGQKLSMQAYERIDERISRSKL